ncbi:GTP-binding protein [Imleria badia]|nr:GTP-binding protein [Imleria badia]
MSSRAAVVRKKFPRFRILVVGRANAGKTTLLQRVRKTTESPIVRDRKGNKINTAVKGTVERGEHDIEHEISFKSNNRFVFHDSRGFEAGSEDELQKVHSFIEEHAKDKKLPNRLHAIWYCIPMHDHSRPITVAEEAFFSKFGTGKVPVIAIFTKFDALHTVAFGELREQGKGIQEALGLASKHAEWIFKNNDYYGMLQAKEFPPKDFVCMGGMDKEWADCTALINCTAVALDDEMLETLLVSAQQVNLQICVDFAVRRKVVGHFSPLCNTHDLL